MNQTDIHKNNKFKIFIWTLFDFANTSFSITMVTFVFAVYFKDFIADKQSIGDFYWSIATGISMLVVAIISPILGAISDFTANKKKFLLVFTLLCIIATSLLYFAEKGMIFYSIFFFILANIGFEAGLVFYDSFLPELTTENNLGRVSGYGFAMGYLGSFVSIVMIMPLLNTEYIKLSFVLSALFFLIFASPFFFIIKEKKNTGLRNFNPLYTGYNRVISTIKNLKHYKNLGKFLLAFFFYIEGVNTAIYFSGIYASTTLGFSLSELTLFFLITQTTAILGSIIFGVIADKIGQKRTLYITLFLWLIVVVFVAIVTDKTQFYFIGLIAGLGMGSTQSVSRSLMSKLIPADKKTEFFGFYSFFGKSSAILGPLVFGLVSWLSNSQRYAILSVSVFFITGMILLLPVNEK